MGGVSSPSPVPAAAASAGDPEGVPSICRPVEPLAAVHLLLSSPHMVASWGFLLLAVLIFGELGLRTGAAEWLSFRRRRTVVEGTWNAPPGTVLAAGTVPFVFHDQGGRRRTRTQAVDPTLAERLRLRKRFSVVYPSGSPYLARVAGSRLDRVPFWPALCLLSGLLLLYALHRFLGSLNLGFERLRLLRSGRLAWGHRVGEEEELFLPFLPLHQIRFEFLDEGGVHHRVHSETLHPDRGKELEYEALFYDPEDLDEVVSQGSLPASLLVQKDGQVELSHYLPFLKGFTVAMGCLASGLVYGLWLTLRYL